MKGISILDASLLPCTAHSSSPLYPHKALAAASRAQRACGGPTVITPASSIAPTATRAWGKPEHVCVDLATGESPVRTVSVVSAPQKCAGCSVCLRSLFIPFSPRMQSWHVWRPVQKVVPLLRPDLPLPPCDRRVRLPARTHRRQLWPRLTSSTITQYKSMNTSLYPVSV